MYFILFSNTYYCQPLEMVSDDDKSVIDTNNMKYFYNPDYEHDEGVRETWYLYVMKFLPLVSKQWGKLLSHNNVKECISMFTCISISDEALVRWFIILWLNIIKDIDDKKISLEAKSKGKGPHDTKANIKLYTVIHNEIETARNDYYAAVRWNKIFWDELKKRNLNLFEERKCAAKYALLKNNETELPLPDLNKSQEFLATFCLEPNHQTSYETENDKNKGVSV
jgi:hypothetical protein